VHISSESMLVSSELDVDARNIREEYLGNRIYLTAHIHMITPCRIVPRCRYCSLASRYASVRAERDVLTMSELLEHVRRVNEIKEITSVVLVGGSDLRGYDDVVLDIVKRVRQITDMEIAIDVGAPLKVETLEALRDYDVVVYSSIETINREAFREAKPGDSLDLRIELLENLERLGMDSGTVIMNMGVEKDVYDSIDFLKKYRHLKYLYISTFTPVRGTPWEDRKPASFEVSLKAIEYARRALPRTHIGLANVEIEQGSILPWVIKSIDRGAGNTFAALLIYKHRIFDYIKEMVKLEKLGFEIVRRV